MLNIRDLEKLRKKIILKKLLVYLLSFLFVILFDTLFLKKYYNTNIFLVILYIGFCFFINSFIGKKQIKKYNSELKKYIFMYSFENILNNYNYKYDSGISNSVISSTNMIPDGDIFKSYDLISGTYKNIKFMSSYVSIEDEDIHGETTQHIKVFKGLYLIFDFNRCFKSNIKIYNKYFDFTKNGGWFDIVANKIKKNKIDKIIVNDSEFDNKFRIYMEDNIKITDFLDCELIDKIKKLNNKLEGNLLFCFINNQLHIAIDGKSDFFDNNIIKKINIQSYKNKVLDIINPIFDFIDLIESKNNLFID